MEKAQTDLGAWIHKEGNEKPGVFVATKILVDILRGVEALNSKNMAHCDLKPNNILLFDLGENKSIDIY